MEANRLIFGTLLAIGFLTPTASAVGPAPTILGSSGEILRAEISLIVIT